MEVKELFESAVNFVLKREKTSGGFGATPLLPPTIEDTYFAINTLLLLEVNFEKEKHIEFLLNQEFPKLTLEPACRLVELLKKLGSKNALGNEQIEALTRIAIKKVKKGDLRLSDIFWTHTILKELKPEKNTLNYLKTEALELLKKEKPSLKNYYYGYRVLGREFPSELVEEIISAQNPDGGFGFYKGTTSYTENAFFACYVLKGLRLKPKNPSKLLEFLLSCRNKDGGFGRNPQGISFLSTTYYAVWIIKNYFLK